MSNSIAEPETAGKHDELVVWINRLLIDLKIELIENPATTTKKITIERLDEGTRLSRELQCCREQPKRR